jgi:hypothetical protein
MASFTSSFSTWSDRRKRAWNVCNNNTLTYVAEDNGHYNWVKAALRSITIPSYHWCRTPNTKHKFYLIILSNPMNCQMMWWVNTVQETGVGGTSVGRGWIDRDS